MAGSLAQDALQYRGYGYVFGGVPAHNHAWDCSSFLNWCAGNDLGMAIPGYAAGSYHGQVHGPVVLDWSTWNGCTTIPESQAVANDLAMWPGPGGAGHIGIVTGPNQMISALNTSLGTLQSPIHGYGPIGVPLIFRRITGASLTSATQSTSLSDSLSGCLSALGIPIGVAAYALYRGSKRRWHLPGSQHDYS